MDELFGALMLDDMEDVTKTGLRTVTVTSEREYMTIGHDLSVTHLLAETLRSLYVTAVIRSLP